MGSFKARTLVPFFLCGFLTLLSGACGPAASRSDSGSQSADAGAVDSGAADWRPDSADRVIEPLPAATESSVACRVTEDCASGSFCMMGVCAVECERDADCDAGLVCGTRGQCETAAGSPEGEPPVVSLGRGRILREPASNIVEIAPGQQEAVLTFDVELDDDVSDLPFRLERDDGVVVDRHPWLVDRLVGGRHELLVQTGAADPLSATPRAVRIDLVTPDGTVNWTLQPESSLSGAWAGEARIAAAGGAVIDVSFGLRVEPEAARLSEAEAVWLLWPMGEGFFAATGQGDRWVEVRMSFDALQNSWIAQIQSAWSGDEGVSPGPGGTVARSLRVELREQGTRLSGRLLDRWSGLYEFRTLDGQRQPSVSGVEATLSARRVASTDGFWPPATVDVSELAPPTSGNWPEPELGSCIALADQALCEAGHTLDALGEIPAPQAVECAIEFAEHLAAADSASALLAEYFESDTTVDMPFSEFMQGCVDGRQPACASSPESACALELLASFSMNADTTPAARERLVRAAALVARDSSVGPRLRIFGRAMNLRADWLRQAAWPSFAATAIRSATEARITEWHTEVVEGHGALFEQGWTAAALLLMGQELGSESGADVRARQTLEASQSWVASVDAMGVEAERWHVTLQESSARRQQFERLSRALFVRYVQSLALGSLNEAAGVGWMNQTMAASLGRGWASVSRLNLSLRDAVFERDGEVVLAASVGAESGLDALLFGRRTLAMNAIGQARAQTDSVLAELRTEAMREADLSARFDQGASVLLQELAELCGKPAACAVLDPADPSCEIDVEDGTCGLARSELRPEEPTADDASEAGRALLAIEQAALGIRESEAALDLHLTSLGLHYEELRAQAMEIEEWNLLRMEGILATSNVLSAIATQRRAGVEALELNLQEQQFVREQGVAERMALLDQQEGLAADELGYTMAELEARRALRESLVRMGEQNIEGWNRIVVQGVESDYESQLDEIEERHRQERARRAADAAARASGGIFQGVLGLLQGDPTRVISGTLDVAGAGASLVGGWDREANRMAAARERDAALRSAELSLAREEAAVEQARISNELERLAEIAALDRQRRGIELQQIENDIVRSREAETLRLAQLQASGELQQREYDLRMAELQADLQLAQLELQADLAYREQLSGFRARQVAFQNELLRVTEYELRIIRAELALKQAIASFVSVVDRARFGRARLDRVRAQRTHVAMLVGSPDAIFERASTLQRAELAIAEARRAMLDWLIAIEHYAVRPFAAQRAVILLTTSVDELQAVATELERLSARCGGAWNRRVQEVSIRDAALGLNASIVDPVTGAVVSPAERFRSVLANGFIDVDGRTRYRTERTVEDLMARGGFWGATFGIDPGDFANLASTCNARVRSVGVQLVGDLGIGTPTVTLIHDGQGSLRSCQADIEQIVESLQAQTTSYGATTVVRGTPRSISPVGGVNEMPPSGEFNESWAGMPLAGRYTLLIDREVGDNAGLDWDALQDVVLAIEYEYQDVFSEGACN